AAIMGRRPAPSLAADPRPPIRILPKPAAVTEWYPAARHTRWRPAITVFGDLFPTAVIREIFDTDDFVAGIAIRVRITALKSTIPLGYPAIERIRRRETDKFVPGRVHAINPNFPVLDTNLSATGCHGYPASAR